MKVLLTGGSGFVGRLLCAELVRRGHRPTVLARGARVALQSREGVEVLVGDPMTGGPWQDEVAGFDTAFNLAGASIFTPWTDENKRLIRESRIRTTRNLVEALPATGKFTLVSTSAVGYYGHRDDEAVGEEGSQGDDFLAALCGDWEAEALAARSKGARVVITRFGIVLDRGGGALEQMIRPFKFFVGGPLGSGRQWSSWIHRHDLVAALVFLLESGGARGSFNLTSPEPVTNARMAAIIGRVMKRPALFTLPAAVIKWMMGEMSEMILTGQRVLPNRLLAQGFCFAFPQLEDALMDILRSSHRR